MPTAPPAAPILGVILAGGAATRMGGGDKGLRLLGGRPVLAHVIDRIRPQLGRLVLNANGDGARFAGFGLPVIPDGLPGQPGPLAGVLAGLEHAASDGFDLVLSVPADAPFLPPDLAARLLGAGAPAVAASGGRVHPVVALWPVSARDAVRAALAAGRQRVGDALQDAAVVEWADQPVDPFFNVNTPADLAAAAAHARTRPPRHRPANARPATPDTA